MYPFLVADIGGTNARFAIISEKTEMGYEIDHLKVLPGVNYSTFSEAISAYLDRIPDIKPVSACIAIAGPVGGDHFKMTNLSWSFSKKALQSEFGFEHLEVINDYTAVAAATSGLKEKDLISVKPGLQLEKASKACLGPGTGLGVAGLVYAGGTWTPVPGEGGHVNLAPTNSFENDIIGVGLSRFGHVSAETFISGPGLVNLYSTICEVLGVQANRYEPKDITGKALDNTDQNCVKTLSTFCGFLGSFCGNLALTYGAKGGVYLTGGILPRIKDFLIQSEFTERFCSKGIMSHFVEDIPVNIINHPETAFLGAAIWLDQAH